MYYKTGEALSLSPSLGTPTEIQPQIIYIYQYGFREAYLLWKWSEHIAPILYVVLSFTPIVQKFRQFSMVCICRFYVWLTIYGDMHRNENLERAEQTKKRDK